MPSYYPYSLTIDGETADTIREGSLVELQTGPYVVRKVVTEPGDDFYSAGLYDVVEVVEGHEGIGAPSWAARFRITGDAVLRVLQS